MSISWYTTLAKEPVELRTSSFEEASKEEESA